MLNSISNRKLVYVLALGMLLVGCGPMLHQPLTTSRARLGPETPIKKELLSLPAPEQKIVTAVYKFRDQTGQYKPSESGASWSTAITQGATTILLRVLEESGWFVPIERENVGNLLNERKIIRASRAEYTGAAEAGDQLLPPLLFAGIIIEGGIISYESNVLTGGAGIRYFGTGVSGRYREDRVSIYLRAVSTSNGKILKTVYTTKSILSQEVSTGVFRYVKLKRLLEAETGYTYNEPSEMAVTEAIEKAVVSLVFEGVEDNLWGFANEDDIHSAAFEAYVAERDALAQKDHVGVPFEIDTKGKIRFGLSALGNYYQGDYSGGAAKPGAQMRVGSSVFIQNLFADISIQYQQANWTLSYPKSLVSTDLSLSYYMMPKERISPYISLGAGTGYQNYAPTERAIDNIHPYLHSGAGLELGLSKRVFLDAGIYYNYFLKDQIDHTVSGKYNDAFWGFKFGLNIYLFKNSGNMLYF